MNYFTVDILTPSKIVAKNVPADSLLVPTIQGQINVLPNHTHIVSKLTTGMLTVFGGADYADRYFTITTGVCKVLEDKVIIMSNVSEESFEIDVDRAKEALKTAEERLKNTEGLSDEEIEKYSRKVERAKLRIQMADFVRTRN